MIRDAEQGKKTLTFMKKPVEVQAELDKVLVRQAQITAQFETLSASAKSQVDALKAEISQLEQQLAAAGMSDFDPRQAEQQLEQLKNQEAQLNKQIGQFEEHLRYLTALKAEVGTMRADLAEERRQAEIQAFWEIGFRQMKLDIIDQFLPDFEALVNTYLERLKVNLRVAFGTQKEKASASKKDRLEGRAFKEEFNVEVFKDGREPLPYGLMSKGQRGRIGGCVGMALRELTKERGNNVFDFFFLDEIADALDESGLRELVNLIDTLPGQKLVISHNDFMKDFFEDRIVVEIENDVSTIRACA